MAAARHGGRGASQTSHGEPQFLQDGRAGVLGARQPRARVQARRGLVRQLGGEDGHVWQPRSRPRQGHCDIAAGQQAPGAEGGVPQGVHLGQADGRDVPQVHREEFAVFQLPGRDGYAQLGKQSQK